MNSGQSSDDTDRAEEAVDAVISNLYGRRGFDYWWDDIDGDVREDIRQALADEIRSVYSDTGRD